MSVQPTAAIDDLSAFIIAGRVRARPGAGSATEARTPAQGIEDAVEAERIGFRRVFLSERWNLKEAGALLGAAGARTSRIGLGTGVLTPASRHPLHAAALGSTMQAAFGPRFVAMTCAITAHWPWRYCVSSILLSHETPTRENASGMRRGGTPVVPPLQRCVLPLRPAL